MRILDIILKSLKLPFKEYKSFIVVFILALFCEIISGEFYSVKLGNLSIAFMIINSIITLIILGIMMAITYGLIFNKKIELDFKRYLLVGVKEYLITFYYVILTFFVSSLFILPTGVYSNLYHIHEYILSGDINTTALTLHNISHQLPVDLSIGFQHSIQINLIIAIFIFVLFSSFGFIGKILLLKSANFKHSFDLRLIHKIIKQIGYKRYLKFILAIGVILVVLFNVLILLEYFIEDIVISAILESFLLFFSTNAFYLIYLEKDN